MICARGLRYSRVCEKFVLYGMAKYFKALRRIAIFSFVFSGLHRLKISKWIKFNSRQVLRQRNSLSYNGLYQTGLMA